MGAATDLAAVDFAGAALGVVDRVVDRGVVVRVDGLAGVAFGGVAAEARAGAAGFAGVAGLAAAAAADDDERGCRGAAGLRGVLAVFLGVLVTRAAGVRAGGFGWASGRSGSESTRQPYQPLATVRGSITNRQHRAGRSGPRTRGARKVIPAQCRVQIFTYR